MNRFEIKCLSNLKNEPVVRNAIALFASTANCTLEDIIDIKTIVSEGVSNAIIHGYENDLKSQVFIEATLDEATLTIVIQDYGVGIKNIEEAMKVNFSSKDRSGLGLTIIKSLSDEMDIKSKENVGTRLEIKKVLSIKESNG